MIKISVVIITYNEERRIGGCIDSVYGVADEVLVVDSYSTDDTEKIIKKKGVRLLQNEFKNYREQKNFANAQASYDFILSLDADERLSDVLREEIKRLKMNWTHDSYMFNRRNNYCGKWIMHCGWYPDKRIRLFDRRRASWGGGDVHEKLVLHQGATFKRFELDILHYSFSSIADHARKAIHFSEMVARQTIAQGRGISIWADILLNPWLTFIKKYFFQLGFLDGFYGFVICVLSAHSNFLKYTRTWQLKHGDSNDSNQ